MSRTLPNRFSLRKKRPNSPEICISGDFGRFRANSGAQNRPKSALNSPEMPEIYFGRSKYGLYPHEIKFPIGFCKKRTSHNPGVLIPSCIFYWCNSESGLPRKSALYITQ